MSNKKQLVGTIVIIFLLMTFVLAYIFSSFYKSSVDNIMELGVSNMNSQATMIEDYISKGREVLWVTADSVDYMMQNHATSDEILQFFSQRDGSG